MKSLASLILSLSLIGAAAQAQTVADVTFAPGSFGTNVSGTVVGDQYFDYKLGANAGQEMFVDLTVADTNGDGVIYFNILPPGSDGVAIYNSSMNGNTATVPLPEKGEYTIRVYLMGNDRDTGKSVGYNIDLSIQ